MQKPPRTRSQPNLATQPQLLTLDATPAASAFSAPNTATLARDTPADDAYLSAWLRGRLDPATLTLLDDSALTVTPHDQRQIARLLQAARARGLTLTASTARSAA